jgi:hypothetical protein
VTPFHSICIEPGLRETRCIHVLAPGGPLPVGEYAYLEFYCEDLACDCRRVLLQVTSRAAPSKPMATINFGWESAEFYTAWMHGDKQAGRDITSASLDPLNPQSKYADWFLDYFQQYLVADPDYVARLRDHYEQFKRALCTRPADVFSPPPAMPRRQPAEREETPCQTDPAPPRAASPMTVPEILQQLSHVPDQADFAPYEAALQAAIEQREAITPELIAALDRVSANPAHYRQNPHECLYLFAIYLLCHFRERRALDAFLRFFSLPGEDALDLTGDSVTEHGAAILASVCGGDPAPLLRLAHDESVNPFVREAAIVALLVQAGWGERSREAVIEELRRLFHTLPKPGHAYVWAGLVCAVCDFNAPELLSEARQAFAAGLVDLDVIGLEDLEASFSRTGPYRFRSCAERYQEILQRNAPIDAVIECSGWLCFRNEDEEDEDWEDYSDDDEDPLTGAFGPPPQELAELTAPRPYIAPPKVGRNDPCPCGSGKKYKKCCGQ